MELLALIAVPFICALIYILPLSRRLPRLLPVLLLTGLGIVLMAFGPSVHDAMITKTPLIRQIDGVPLSFHLDGLSLFLALVMTISIMAVLVYASDFYQEIDAYRRIVRRVLVPYSVTLGLVLTDHLMAFSLFYIIMISFTLVFLVTEDTTPPRWIKRVPQLPLLFLFLGLAILGWAGGSARQLPQSLDIISQISMANLSKGRAYELFVGLILGSLLSYCLMVIWYWLRQITSSLLIHAALASLFFSGHVYFVVRFYPALHDNLLWWYGVTAIGLLMMLVGAVWALRQRDVKAMLVCMVLSTAGACVALLGLPEYLGVRAVLITISVYGLVMPALFLSVNLTRRTIRFGVIGLAGLSMAIVDVWTIQAFYESTLAGSGLMLAVVVVSVALMTMSAIKLFFEPVGAQHAAPFVDEAAIPLRAWYAMPLQGILGTALAFLSIVIIFIFDPLIAPLMPTFIKGQSALDISAVALSLLAWGGGVIFYLTRDSWFPGMGGSQPHELPTALETQKS